MRRIFTPGYFAGRRDQRRLTVALWLLAFAVAIALLYLGPITPNG